MMGGTRQRVAHSVTRNVRGAALLLMAPAHHSDTLSHSKDADHAHSRAACDVHSIAVASMCQRLIYSHGPRAHPRALRVRTGPTGRTA